MRACVTNSRYEIEKFGQSTGAGRIYSILRYLCARARARVIYPRKGRADLGGKKCPKSLRGNTRQREGERERFFTDIYQFYLSSLEIVPCRE